MRDTDESLLKSFAATRDEAAFRTLADRYLGLVFHTALRRTGSRPLAEEVSQNILCALAKKASSLAKNPDLLAAWLHRATLYESSKAMRSESSHQRRKQLQHPDSIPPTGVHGSSPWIDAVPHLDVALDKLPEADRGILMLHYFEKRSFPDIARSLGKNSAAIQKQAQRALEKLSRLLRARGVALSVTAIAAGLAGEFAKAAPVSFLQSATTSVLNGTNTYTTTGLTLMAISKSKALVPLALLLFAVPLTLQQVAISKIQKQNAALRMEPRPQSRHSSSARLVSPAVRRQGVSTNTDVLVLYDEQKAVLRQGALMRDAFAGKLESLSPETLDRLIRETAGLRVNRESKGDLLNSLLAALAKKDPDLAVTTAMDLIKADRGTAHALGSRREFLDHFFTWAETHRDEAKSWIDELEHSGSAPNEAFVGEFRARLLASMIVSRSPDLREYLRTRPEEERFRLAEQAIDCVSSLEGEQAIAGCAASIPFVRESMSDAMRNSLLGTMVRNIIQGSEWDDYTSMNRLFEKAELASAEKERVAHASARMILATGWNPFDPGREARVSSETETFLRRQIPQQADRVFEEVRKEIHQHELRSAEETIDELQRNTDVSDDELVRSLTTENLRSQLSSALKMAERIRDPSKRDNTINVLKQRH